MRQLQYVSPGRLEWRESLEPTIASALAATVRPLAVTRCDLDIAIATGRAGMQGPFAFGHETYGEVMDVGSDVRAVQPGDRVIVPFQISCGACARCRAGLTGLCESVPYRSSYGMAPLSGVDYGGGLADLLLVPFADHMLAHAPEHLAPEALAGAADNLTTALSLVAGPLRVQPGARILVVGGLGVALHAVQCAIALGSEKVVYVGTDERALAIAGRIGAEAIRLAIGPDTPAIGAFPFTIDATAEDDGLAFAVRCTAYEGLCQRTYGGFLDRSLAPLKDMYARNITLKLGRVHARARMDETLALMRSGHFCPEHVITDRVRFDDAAEAMLEDSLKLVLVRDEA